MAHLWAPPSTEVTAKSPLPKAPPHPVIPTTRGSPCTRRHRDVAVWFYGLQQQRYKCRVILLPSPPTPCDLHYPAAKSSSSSLLRESEIEREKESERERRWRSRESLHPPSPPLPPSPSPPSPAPDPLSPSDSVSLCLCGGLTHRPLPVTFFTQWIKPYRTKNKKHTLVLLLLLNLLFASLSSVRSLIFEAFSCDVIHTTQAKLPSLRQAREFWKNRPLRSLSLSLALSPLCAQVKGHFEGWLLLLLQVNPLRKVLFLSHSHVFSYPTKQKLSFLYSFL